MESRTGPGVMRDELQSLGNSLFDFDLQRIVIAACIHAKVVPQVRRAASQLIRKWNIGQATDSLRDREIRIDVMVEEGTCAVRVRSAVPGDASLIDVICRSVTRESVRALISDVSHFHGHCGGQLVLDRCVPHIYASWSLHRRTNSRIHAVCRSTQRNRAVSTDRWELGRLWPRGGVHLIYGNVVIDGCGIEVMRLDRLVHKDGEVLRHGMAKVRAEYSNVETAAVADTHDSFWPQLICDAYARPECADIVSDVAV